MSTPVTILVENPPNDVNVAEAIHRAFEWFGEVETRCSRFDSTSELRQLGAEPVQASAILYEAVGFALMVAEETGGAFDPTVGHRMERRGFNREHRTGETIQTRGADDVNYRDVELDARARTIKLRRPLTLDLGAVAKGLAVDTAARELRGFARFSIDAGGDLYLGGENWRVGIRHPRRDGELIETLQVSNQAVCTSGDYEKPGHIIGGGGLASATVVAPGAMLADALATAAFVLGPEAGMALLERMGVEGLLVTPELERHQTRGLRRAA